MNVVEYIFNLLSSRVKKIIPNNEIKYMPKVEGIYKSHRTLCDLVYVLERFVNTKVLPYEWEIIKSSKFDTSLLSEKSKQNLDRLQKMLIIGDVKVNSPSYGFLPKTSKKYYETNEDDKSKRRYQVDFSNQVFGIKHFHLDSHDKNEDKLLFYTTLDQKIFFLSIGCHEDIYTDKNLKILIEEFENVLPHLGIQPMDITIGSKPSNSKEEVQKMWTSGLNVAFIINGQYYSCSNYMTFSRIDTETILKVQGIYYEIQQGIKKGTNFSGTNNEVIVCQEQEEEKLAAGIICLKENGSEFEISIEYLKKLGLVDYLIEEIN
jgi:hypothetical protein